LNLLQVWANGSLEQPVVRRQSGRRSPLFFIHGFLSYQYWVSKKTMFEKKGRIIEYRKTQLQRKMVEDY